MRNQKIVTKIALLFRTIVGTICFIFLGFLVNHIIRDFDVNESRQKFVIIYKFGLK